MVCNSKKESKTTVYKMEVESIGNKKFRHKPQMESEI